MTTVLLWDIDGTLLTTGRAGVFALEQAAEALCGRPVDLQDMHTAGMTDAAIAGAILADCGVDPTPEHVARFLSIYGAALPAHLPRRQGAVLDGVAAILDDLAGEPGVLSLLLTGNVAAGAAAKLAHYGLDGWLSDGAFCEGLGPRADIARRALALAAERLDAAPDPERVFVIGDTPADIACGREVGVRTIGVASGAYDVGALEAAGAWHALPFLPEPAAFRLLLSL